MRWVPATEFIRIWQTSDSLASVAKRCGYKRPGAASVRASNMRLRGYKLKKFNGSSSVTHQPNETFAHRPAK